MSNKTRKKDLIHLAFVLGLIVVLNIVSGQWFFRVDLTAEKRYTLADITRDFLADIDDDIMVKVYLEGDLNVGFQKLSRSTRELLDEFEVATSGDLHYHFVSPDNDAEGIEELKEYGAEAVPVFESSADGRQIQSHVYPYAIVRMGDYEIVVNLLEHLQGRSGAENLHISQESLEYKFVDAIGRLISDEVKAIAFLEGHGELDELDVYSASETLSHYYQVDRGSLTDDPYILDNYEALIIAKPQERFSEKDKFIIDQYIMRGGRVFWLVDAVNVTLDSLRQSTETVGMAPDINLADQLFRYGVRINPDLVQDMQAAQIPINVSPAGQQPRFVPVPWMFNPLLHPGQSHAITRNINLVRSEFISSLDTVGNLSYVDREVILQTGRRSRIHQVPVYISLALVNEEPQPEEFNLSHIPVAVAMEGRFPSAFANRSIPPGVNMSEDEVLSKSEHTRMVVVSDGDIIRNEVRRRHTGSPQPQPLGFDEMSNHTFGNEQFVLNAVNYLADEKGWLSLRNRSYQLRMLDREELSSNLTFWQWFNMLLPLIALFIGGVIVIAIRKTKHGKKSVYSFENLQRKNL
ncbi:gliding motility-associated ABC transporter substrate-binding protein GldG [Marinilabiliaceae bacterium ANBcel2]|nr:gliding motility-associated ABC transporter substrate-binding protein GldG [Marinilabiliaceae bacterium ANBcel2]